MRMRMRNKVQINAKRRKEYSKKKKGWKGDSHRHSLASRGISTVPKGQKIYDVDTQYGTIKLMFPRDALAYEKTKKLPNHVTKQINSMVAKEIAFLKKEKEVQKHLKGDLQKQLKDNMNGVMELNKKAQAIEKRTPIIRQKLEMIRLKFVDNMVSKGNEIPQELKDKYDMKNFLKEKSSKYQKLDKELIDIENKIDDLERLASKKYKFGSGLPTSKRDIMNEQSYDDAKVKIRVYSRKLNKTVWKSMKAWDIDYGPGRVSWPKEKVVRRIKTRIENYLERRAIGKQAVKYRQPRQPKIKPADLDRFKRFIPQ